jgi:hypothetical protein
MVNMVYAHTTRLVQTIESAETAVPLRQQSARRCEDAAARYLFQIRPKTSLVRVV